jgi:predicted CXXCH cytochrome family protein
MTKKGQRKPGAEAQGAEKLESLRARLEPLLMLIPGARLLRNIPRWCLVVLALFLIAAALPFFDWWLAIPESATAKYVGRGTCVKCHQTQHDLWHGSHHDKAMDFANSETVLGDFNGSEFAYHGVTSRFTREGEKFFVTTDGPDGKLQKFPIKYTFGVEPLQQYMIEMERGRVQVLSIAWDTNRRRWFHLYENDPKPIRHDDPLHWTQPGQNWNHVCADCHSTNLQKNYDNATDTFRTSFSEIDVSCETCHGPGSLHVQSAEKWFFWDRKRGYALPRLKDKESSAQFETCARCHSHRSEIYPGYHGGPGFLDHYLPVLLDSGLYHHDGQIDDEVYEYGSFQQSLMYKKGVRCSDCHDPHSTRVKFSGNALCTQCHTPAKYDTPAHHHHKADGTGASCIECHMPSKKYMVVDPRRDHSLRVPRPDASVLLGTPNACTGCHLENKKSQEWPDYAAWLSAARRGEKPAVDELARLDKWAAEKVVAWYGPQRRESPHYALTLAAAIRDELEPGAPQKGDRLKEIDEITARLIKLAAQRDDAGPIVRASAVSLFANYAGEKTLAANAAALKDPEPLVRLSATRNLMTFYGVTGASRWDFDKMRDAEMQRAFRQLFAALWTTGQPLLDDPVRVVRLEAGRVLSLVPRQFLYDHDQQRLARVLSELTQGYLHNGDNHAAQLNLAQLYASQSQLDKAEEAYRTSLKRLARQIPARTGLAELYRYRGQAAEAEKLLREALEISGDLEGSSGQMQKAELHYQLGLLLATQPARRKEGVAELSAAVEVAPQFARARYAYATALLEQDDLDGAERHYRLAYDRFPNSQEFRDGLAAAYQRQVDRLKKQRNWSQALSYAEKLVQLLPGDSTMSAQARELRQRLP